MTDLTRFRIVPPPVQASEEIILEDDQFKMRAVRYFEADPAVWEFCLEDEVLTTAYLLKIFRARVRNVREPHSSDGVWLYWEYQSGLQESSLTLGTFN